MHFLLSAILFFFSASVLQGDTVEPKGQSVRETVELCRKDLRGDSPLEKRRAAVLVLGKYDTPEVTEILGECLKDPDADVRRSALVALAESPLRIRQQANRVLECLLDDDVHIRRLASSNLDVCLAGGIGGFVRVTQSGTVIRSVDDPPQNARKMLEEALRDEDAEVRRNVLNAVSHSAVMVDWQAVTPFLRNESPEVICQALRIVVQGEGSIAERLALLEPFVRHENIAVRSNLADLLQTMPGTLALLQELSRDSEPDVRNKALIARANLRSPADRDLAEDLRKALSSGAMRTQQGERMLTLFAELSDENAWDFVHEALIGDGVDADTRISAWMQVLRHREWQSRLSPNELADAMSTLADNPSIRSMLIGIIRKRAEELSEENLEKMLSSALPQCRRAFLDLLRNFPKERQQQILMELMMDDDGDIRLQTVRQVASLRPDGWEELLSATLEDPDASLQLAAAQGLSRGTITNQEVKDALRAWLPQCSDAAFRLRLERQLRQR